MLIILGKSAQDKAIKQFGNFQVLSNNFIDSLRGIDTLKYLGLMTNYFCGSLLFSWSLDPFDIPFPFELEKIFFIICNTFIY